MSAHATVEWLARLLLGAPGPQRARTMLTGLSWLVYMLVVATQYYLMSQGLEERRWVLPFCIVSFCVPTLFFVLVRSGASLWMERRWGLEPSLSLPQTIFAMADIIWSYAFVGELRGGSIAMMILVLMFGMYEMRPRQVQWLAGCSLLGTALVMAWCSLGPQPRYDVRIEVVHLMVATAVIGAGAMLSMRLATLRRRLSAQKAELQQALTMNQRLASLDALTGLLNRRAMTERLAPAAAPGAPRRAVAPAALALLDIDHFKQVNDSFGHQAGDNVLRRFAELAQAELRSGDTLARWGGEEFLLLMPATPCAEGQRVADRLRANIAAANFDAAALGLRVTLSAGIATLAEGGDPHAAVDRADQALYRAKRNGRNRTEVEAPPDDDNTTLAHRWPDGARDPPDPAERHAEGYRDDHEVAAARAAALL